ncbi:MAG: site-2 protease family protein [Patescibacteria group bacterium]|nr:site-2 protease family protein [Patescibacteria group bacterium]
MSAIFYIVVLVFSVILHEVSHGYMANYLGDPTARLQGRLTLNPLSHIDPLGTIFLPLLMWAGQGFSPNPVLIGYAKPVPYNPYNLAGKYDELLVAGAGPAMNVLLALIFGLTIRFAGAALDPNLMNAFSIIVIVNIWLALFNLVPIPPLDGSKVLSGILPGALGRAYGDLRRSLERMGVLGGTLIVLVVFYFILAPFLVILLGVLFRLLTGVSF